jgi:hypothetical protein
LRPFASIVAALALLLVPAVSSAQEGWIGADDVRTPAVPAEPPPVPGSPPPSIPPPPPAPPRTRMRSVKLMTGGIIMATLGTAALVGGIAKVEYDEAHVACQPASLLGCAAVASIDAVGEAGYVFLAVFGGTLVASGAAMIGVGASPVRADRFAAAPAITVGPRSARLTWSF